jgi:amino acid adenylation domain-containing protein
MPIEPNYPSNRIRYMVRDSNMKLLVTNCSLSGSFPFEGIIINLSRQECTKEAVSNLDLVNSPDDPVYMIYTSGSTGKPKGIVVAHKNLFNYVKWRIDALGHNAEDISLQLLSIAFDGFATNFYPALLSGGSVVFVDNVYWRDSKYISEVISAQKITNFSLVPLLYRMILENGKNTMLKSLRFVVLAGEESDTSLIELSQQKYPEVLLVNEYGPTETTIATTSFVGMDAGNISIIGRPIANNKIYILDKDKQLMPIGLFGELCVSGEGVSKGYRSRAKLTADKFIENPFSENGILYKTGDLARWRQDGTIELLGRIDNQVKVMGYRIEPGEIEAVLSGHKAINKTVVTTCTNAT